MYSTSIVIALSHGVAYFLGSAVSRLGRLKPPTGPIRAEQYGLRDSYLRLVVRVLDKCFDQFAGFSTDSELTRWCNRQHMGF